MKTLFTISLLLFSISLFATGNDNDIMRTGTTGITDTYGSTGTTGTSYDSYGYSGTIGSTGAYGSSGPTTAMTPEIELNTENYKVTFKEYAGNKRIEKTVTRTGTYAKNELRKDANDFSQKVEAIIKTCKVKMFGATAKDYFAKNNCFLTMIQNMDPGKHQFILGTVAAQCKEWDSDDTDLYMTQRRYLCYRNALRAALKTRKGLVIGWRTTTEHNGCCTTIENSIINSDEDSSSTTTNPPATTNPTTTRADEK